MTLTTQELERLLFLMAQMTDPATIEKIARKYCKLMGLDPDTVVFSMTSTKGKPLWENFAHDMVSALAMSTAIREVKKDE